MYLVNEIFYTLQGEGHWSGRPAVFCRFSKCNLWSGREADRSSAICTFCDTDFADYTTFHLDELAAVIEAHWPISEPESVAGRAPRMVVFTGGEPLLQLDDAFIREMHRRHFYIAIETNGTKPVPDFIDWVCVSPKTPRIRIEAGDELKLVYPQQRITPEMFADHGFTHHWLSPMDGPNYAENLAAAIDYVKAHPQWRLNIQTHKKIGVR